MRQMLADTLRDQVLAERVCLGRLVRMSQSKYLTEEESVGLWEQALEEQKHAALFESCREVYPEGTRRIEDLVEKDYHAFVTNTTEDPIFGLPEFCVSERFAQAMLKQAMHRFIEANDVQTAGVYGSVLLDEHEHTSHNRRLLWHLFEHPEIGTALRARYRQRIREGFHKDCFRSAAAHE